jgi:hypothetical protein
MGRRFGSGGVIKSRIAWTISTMVSSCESMRRSRAASLERLLREAVRRNGVNELFETADRLAAANIPPMTMQEIQAQVDALRQARRERAGRS